MLFWCTIIVAMDYFVVGLGNPGTNYIWSRHNVAWILMDNIFGDEWQYDRYLEAKYQGISLESKMLHLVLPQTFMNNSGKTVAQFTKMFSSFCSERLIVIHDDIDLPFGTVRISFDRGSGGHNGVKSIVEHLGSSMFIRIRVGIAKKLDDGRLVKPAVLGLFGNTERTVLNVEISPLVSRIITTIVKQGHAEAMNFYNTR